MKLTYTEHPDYQFPYWVVYETVPTNDNIDLRTIMDVNEWCGKQFGELGQRWGYTRETDSSGAPAGLNTIRVRLFYTKITYNWRFKNKEDAAVFKLTWGGA